MKLAESMKVATLAYWRHSRHHILGGIECKNADVLTVTRTLMLTESEIKISIADMKREISTKPYKHLRMNGLLPSLYPEAHYFYFVVPEELQTKAFAICEELYPNTGLLVFREGELSMYSPHNITLVRPSKRFKRNKIETKELKEIAYAVSNTALRYIDRVITNTV